MTWEITFANATSFSARSLYYVCHVFPEEHPNHPTPPPRIDLLMPVQLLQGSHMDFSHCSLVPATVEPDACVFGCFNVLHIAHDAHCLSWPADRFFSGEHICLSMTPQSTPDWLLEVLQNSHLFSAPAEVELRFVHAQNGNLFWWPHENVLHVSSAEAKLIDKLVNLGNLKFLCQIACHKIHKIIPKYF